MYEHPSLTITAMLQEQEMLNRAVERRRAILERLETRSVPRRRWVDRLRAAFGNGSRSAAAGRPEQASAESGSAAFVSEAADASAPVVVSAGATSGAAESGRAASSTASAGASDSEARRVLLERAPADAGILVAPAR
ncbi:hypothetical protein ACI7YT_17365 [Microbacterium sp. M]|uniref:hypothetical protein n=1 Tax=Microbacterium sp. M TaxID=3377125 RepID=UPI00386A5361